MMKLLREVRCFAGSSGRDRAASAWGREPFWTCRVVVTGPVDERTGYVFDIKRIDALVRESILPDLTARLERDQDGGLPGALRATFDRATGHFSAPVALDSLELAISPFESFAVVKERAEMVRVTRRFEFCAAHRLFCRGFSEEENRRAFGPCSNPNWHGHNYVLEVTAGGTPDPDTGMVIDSASFERAVQEQAIEPFDHKNLNVECEDFKDLNPSVENIARVLWRRLDGMLGRARLLSVRVWETSKTCADYRGE